MNQAEHRTRSPQYPFIGLDEAVTKARKLYEYAKRNTVNVDGALRHWGFSGDTGSSRKTLAAMKYFGLIQQGHGSKDLKLTDCALRIIIEDSESQEHKNAVKTAFLSPKMYQYLWNKWKGELPHDNAIKSHLILDVGFNDSTVKGFIDDYKRSLKYAGMTNDVSISEEITTTNDIINDIFTSITPKEAASVTVNQVQQDKKMLQDVYNLSNSEGQIVIQFPSNMSRENFEDFTDWLLIQHRKIGRSVEGDIVPRLIREEAKK